MKRRICRKQGERIEKSEKKREEEEEGEKEKEKREG